jgi:hypothetical protein
LSPLIHNSQPRVFLSPITDKNQPSSLIIAYHNHLSVIAASQRKLCVYFVEEVQKSNILSKMQYFSLFFLFVQKKTSFLQKKYIGHEERKEGRKKE